jgi:tetratricopeptide (TPR) repeat protein
LTNLRRVSWLAIAGFFLIFPQFGEPTAAQLHSPDRARRFKDWVEAVAAHEPGDFGKPAIDVSTWTGPELEAAVADARRHARTLAKTEPEQANELLLRGAALHADIARLIPEEVTRRSSTQLSVFTVQDGRWLSVRYLSMHWQLGRSLLDAVVPEPAAHPGVRAWYRDTSTDLMRMRSHVEAEAHLARAQQIFPKDELVLFLRGVVHERYSSSLLQAGSASLEESRRGAAAIGNVQSELTKAERFFRDALAVDPDHIDARLRHGHVLSHLGRHHESIAELRRVVDSGPTGAVLYLAHLFLGRGYESLGEFAQARSELEQAAALYPHAQTPRLALSQIERRTGNRAAAQHQLQLLAKLPIDQRLREDPWWGYYDIR